MFYRIVLCVLFLGTSAVGASVSGSEAQANEPNELITLPSKETAEYWVIRSQALFELVPFMTQKRVEFMEIHKLMTQYLDSIGKAEAFVRSGVKSPDKPEIYAQALGIADQIKASGVRLPEKPATWEELVEMAMQYEIHDGYIPTDVADANELAMIQKECEHKQRYGQKVRKELRDIVQKCMNIWVYLGTIDRQADCKVYVYREREKVRQAKEQERLRREAERTARVREMREQREEERAQMRNEQMWESRQRRMELQYYTHRW